MIKLVSIIMPAYNSEKYIQQSIDSVLSQTYRNYELIIVDDGSIDKTQEIVLSNKDKRLKYIYKVNSGVSAARNLGIQLASNDCDFISFLDSDDLWESKKLEQQLNLFNKDEKLVICGTFCNVIAFDGTFLYYDNSLPIGDNSIRVEINAMNPFITSSVMVRAGIFKLNNYFFDTKRETCEEILLWNKLLKHGCAYNIDYPLVSYRVSPSGLSMLNKDRPSHNELLLNDRISIEVEKIKESYNKKMYKYYCKVVFISIHRGVSLHNARKFLLDGLKFAPLVFGLALIVLRLFPWNLVRGLTKFSYGMYKMINKKMANRRSFKN